MPVYKLLGGAHEKRVKAYASSILYGNAKAVVDTATKLVEERHDQVKIKVGRGEKDVEVLKGVRDALGYGVDIMVDADSAFNVASAIRWDGSSRSTSACGSKGRFRQTTFVAMSASSRPWISLCAGARVCSGVTITGIL